MYGQRITEFGVWMGPPRAWGALFCHPRVALTWATSQPVGRNPHTGRYSSVVTSGWVAIHVGYDAVRTYIPEGLGGASDLTMTVRVLSVTFGATLRKSHAKATSHDAVRRMSQSVGRRIFDAWSVGRDAWDMTFSRKLV